MTRFWKLEKSPFCKGYSIAKMKEKGNKKETKRLKINKGLDITRRKQEKLLSLMERFTLRMSCMWHLVYFRIGILFSIRNRQYIYCGAQSLTMCGVRINAWKVWWPKTTGKISVKQKPMNKSLSEWRCRWILIQEIMYHVAICSSSLSNILWRVRTELCQSMVIDHYTQSTFHSERFWKGKFREQRPFVFIAQSNRRKRWHEMTVQVRLSPKGKHRFPSVHRS